MVVCKFYQQGNCRYGDNCKFEHPGSRKGFATQNPFSVFQSPANGGGRGNNDRKDPPYNVNPKDAKDDLTAGKNRPQWILSTYGPGKVNPPASLLEGNEFSPEELRARLYELAANGNAEQANQEALTLWSKAEQDIANVANNADHIAKFMEDADQKHPNRHDYCKIDGTKSMEQLARETGFGYSSGSGSGFGKAGGFGQASTSENPFTKSPSTLNQPPAGGVGFGQPSSFGQKSNPFAPASAGSFGQPAPGFGQPAFGKSSQPTSAFGKLSQPASAFGQPTQPSAFGSGGFGRTTAFGAVPVSQPGTTGTAFGQPAQPSAFGKPLQPQSTFGQPLQASAFGQLSHPQSAFGQPSQTTSAFGQPAFGPPSQLSSKPSQPAPFGQPSTSTPFGNPSTSQGGFGPAAASPFSVSSTTTSGQPPSSLPGNPFSRQITTTLAPAQPAASTSPFGQPPQSMNMAKDHPSAGATTSQSTSYLPANRLSITPHPLTNKPAHPLHYSQMLPAPNPRFNGSQLTNYRSQAVQYLKEQPCYARPDQPGKMERIWFPGGAQEAEVAALGKEGKVQDLIGEDNEYTAEVLGAYKALAESGSWAKAGGMPAVPPRREWVTYDF